PAPSPLTPTSDVPAVTLAAGEALVTYEIDAGWLGSPAREFPVTVDPTVCIGAGAGSGSGCDFTSTSGSYDHYIAQGAPDTAMTGSYVRVGWDSQTGDGGTYNNLRGLFYFPDYALPDGASILSAALNLTIANTYGNARGQTVGAYLVTRPWAQTGSTGTWNWL